MQKVLLLHRLTRKTYCFVTCTRCTSKTAEFNVSCVQVKIYGKKLIFLFDTFIIRFCERNSIRQHKERRERERARGRHRSLFHSILFANSIDAFATGIVFVLFRSDSSHFRDIRVHVTKNTKTTQ